MRIFGVSLATIAIVIITAVVVRMYGSKIPVLNGLSAG